jgi:uncharacterized protein
MIDWARVVGFDWDAGNARKSVDKHGVSQMEAEETFFDHGLLVLEDERHSAAERRFHALGRALEGRRLHVAFTLRRNATLIRVISARDMSKRERTIHEESE